MAIRIECYGDEQIGFTIPSCESCCIARGLPMNDDGKIQIFPGFTFGSLLLFFFLNNPLNHCIIPLLTDFGFALYIAIYHLQLLYGYQLYIVESVCQQLQCRIGLNTFGRIAKRFV